MVCLLMARYSKAASTSWL